MAGSAQEERPQITPGERKAPRKKDAGPRALAVLQLSASGKASLVPIAILINGKFWDASAYKANPIPMALEAGTVYEAERTGSSQGLFTVNSALHSNAANVQAPWIGTGAWLPAGTELPTKALKAEAVPVGIDNSDAPPRLTKNPQKEAPPAAPASTTAPASPSAQPSGTSGSGDEPPRLTKPAAAPASPPADSGQQAPSSTAPNTPNESKPGDAKAADRAKAPESDSGAGEGNRPRLRRGKPTEAFDDDVPGYTKPGSAPPANGGKIVVVAGADKGPVQLIPAISDSSGPEPRSYAFDWLKDEEGERRQQIVALAKDQLRAYLDAQAKARIAPKPAGGQTARANPVGKAAKAKDPILENARMIAYDLWTTNQPVLIFSAEAHMPQPSAGGGPAAVASDLQYSILLVAYPDIYNNLHKLYAGVTDKYHLDITPRLELIDSVDADGDGRGELLFRKITDGGTGWVIYRATADKLWKMYDSLNPE